MILVLTIENHKDPLISQLCEKYIQRISGPYKLQIELLPAARVKEPELQKEKESETIIKATKPGDIVILCDEQGKNMHTLEFSQMLNKELSTARGRIVFCIGGAYGFTEELLKKHIKIRLSDMTLPHQLARLVLVEQIYRAFEINEGSGYHHI